MEDDKNKGNTLNIKSKKTSSQSESSKGLVRKFASSREAKEFEAYFITSLKEAGGLRQTYPATVAYINDEYKLTINRGSEDGVEEGDRFLVYTVSSEQIIDPQTNHSLGFLELIRGSGVAVHVQKNMTTIKSDRYEEKARIIKNQSYFALNKGEVIEESEKRLLPFENAEVGDKVKPI